jgi:hypothetical protein
MWRGQGSKKVAQKCQYRIGGARWPTLLRLQPWAVKVRRSRRWSPVECAQEPERPTVEQAHKIMQVHLRCSTATCRHRKAALAGLVEAGRYVLP